MKVEDEITIVRGDCLTEDDLADPVWSIKSAELAMFGFCWELHTSALVRCYVARLKTKEDLRLVLNELDKRLECGSSRLRLQGCQRCCSTRVPR
jgi:hypothetical protein